MMFITMGQSKTSQGEPVTEGVSLGSEEGGRVEGRGKGERAQGRARKRGRAGPGAKHSEESGRTERPEAYGEPRRRRSDSGLRLERALERAPSLGSLTQGAA